jgi:2-methylcitrate synthase
MSKEPESEKAPVTEKTEKAQVSEKSLLDKEPIRKGLVNVVIDETNICAIDGYLGELYYRGYPITELVEKSTFEEVSFLLLFGKLPSQFELEFFKEKLISERDIPDRILMILQSFPRNTTRIELLRTIVSALSLYDEDDYDYSESANIRKGMRIIAKIPTIIAYSHRIKGNMPIIEPSKTLSHAGNFYFMMTGEEPDDAIENSFDKLLILQAEHDLNASTFAARITVSTLSDIYSAIVSAIGTLRGPLHGGANEKVINYLKQEVKTMDNVVAWVEGKIQRKEKMMGFGHRVYKVMDPRATILKKIAKEYWDEVEKDHENHENLYKVGEFLEQTVLEKKGISPNVDFYSAILLHALKVPAPLYTPLFATSRAVGWVTHAIEQLNDNKLIRPRLRYMGEWNKKYTDISER